ncbi:MAG TPA: hypothetical protein VHW00_16525 [Thermoanaerobaculia bacterium]|nr:hypothetical protein [Thermoanaerobaculia bacterium]
MKFVARIAVLLVALIACAWALRKWCYEPYACNAALTDIQNATAAIEELRGQYSQFQRTQNNIERLQKLEPACRADVRLYVLLAANESAAGRAQNAVDAYRKALTIDRRSEIYFGLARELVQLGRTEEAVEAFTVAARFNPYASDWYPSEEILRRVNERLKRAR